MSNLGNTALLEQLSSRLRKPASASAPDKYKWTPLHYAAWHGHLRVIRRLIRDGADPNVITEGGISMLHLLARLEPSPDSRYFQPYIHKVKVRVDAISGLREMNSNRSVRLFWILEVTPISGIRTGPLLFMRLPLLALYTRFNFSSKMKEILTEKPSELIFIVLSCPHSVYSNQLPFRTHQRTALAYAIKSGNTEMVRILLEAGCDPVSCFDIAPDEMLPMLEEYRVRIRPRYGQSLPNKLII